MNEFNLLQPISIRHPGVREMYAHLQTMEAYAPTFYPSGTADRYLAIAQMKWQRPEIEEREDELLPLEPPVDALISA